MSQQEKIHLRFCLKFALVSCDKLVYTICVNRWCNLVPRLLVTTGLARYSPGDGEVFVQTCGTSMTHLTAQKTMQSSTRIFQNKKKSEDKEMDDEFETDNEKEDEQ